MFHTNFRLYIPKQENLLVDFITNEKILCTFYEQQLVIQKKY